MPAPVKSLSEQFRIAHLKVQGKPFSPKNDEQAELLDMIRGNLLTFALGPAGTGKTITVMAAALEALESGQYERIIIVRPAVEAGEKLGHLPGTDMEKVAPFMMPGFENAMKVVGSKKVINYVDSGQIEIVPVAFMRGRTLDNAFIIIDEAQNNDIEQTKMLLTRAGQNAKVVACGDADQNDLEKLGIESGLMDAVEKFKPFIGKEPVAVKTLVEVVRGPIPDMAVRAYATKKPTTAKPAPNQN